MSIKAPNQNSSPDVEKPSSKESWLSKNRGKVALILGIVLGANHRLIVRETLNSLSHFSRITCSKPATKPTRSWMFADPRGAVDSEPSIEDVISSMSSPCELREGTFLAGSHEFDEFCNGGPIEEKAECMSVYDRNRTTYIERIKERSIKALIEGEEAEERGKTDDMKALDLVDSNQMYRENISHCSEYQALRGSYKILLKDFDPVFFNSIKDRIYFENDPFLILGNTLATTEGPYSLVQDRLVPSPYGQNYKVTLMGWEKPEIAALNQTITDKESDEEEKPDVPEVNIDEILKKGDRAALVGFLQIISTLAHEINGHVALFDKRLVNVSGRSPQSREEYYHILPEIIKNELYGYFMDAKMLSYMAERYPEISAMFQESSARREETEMLKKETISCDEKDAGTLTDDLAIEFMLAIMSENLDAYLNAARTGDWRPFKDKILKDILIQQFGLPYLLPYLRDHEGEKYFSSLNKDIGTMMNEESPEKLFEKK
jgi:hypothetical protein